MIKKKQTIGSNPLDAYLQYSPTEQKEEQPRKQRITIHLTVDLIERVKNAVFWQPGTTLTSFAEEALETGRDREAERDAMNQPEFEKLESKPGVDRASEGGS